MMTLVFESRFGVGLFTKGKCGNFRNWITYLDSLLKALKFVMMMYVIPIRID
ncbi:hypothetical protein Sjap_026114 [Stephania japonica]|uniref:Uncharacterized protein n=1 Tax=Stephania japonica TaxID=461633 RepID=A0AAP0EAS3_9MAGN